MEEAFEDESDDEGTDDGQYLNLNEEEGEFSALIDLKYLTRSVDRGCLG